jgi:hypothetical protein
LQIFLQDGKAVEMLLSDAVATEPIFSVTPAIDVKIVNGSK